MEQPTVELMSFMEWRELHPVKKKKEKKKGQKYFELLSDDSTLKKLYLEIYMDGRLSNNHKTSVRHFRLFQV